jgi:hypothetical protein
MPAPSVSGFVVSLVAAIAVYGLSLNKQVFSSLINRRPN